MQKVPLEFEIMEKPSDEEKQTKRMNIHRGHLRQVSLTSQIPSGRSAGGVVKKERSSGYSLQDASPEELKELLEKK